ncbi:cytochrome P450 [Marasmius fiardii PR-910]|nr:cytochrome P450 [Marasmius fiardii PR-910]
MVLTIIGKHSLVGLRSGEEAHRRAKNAVSSAFSPSRLQSHIPVMMDVARKATDKLMHHYLEKREHNGAAVDMYNLFRHLTSDIIGEVGYGYRFNAIETDGANELVQGHQNVVILGSRRSKTGILVEGVIPYLPRTLLKYTPYIPTSAFRTRINFLNLAEAWITAWLADSFQASDSHCTDTGIIGSAALSSNNQKREYFDTIRQQTPTLLVAGTDTSTNGLSFAFYELAKHPAWQEQIRKEILQAQATGIDLNLDKLDCLNAHIKETLRLHPTVPVSERMAFENTVLPLSQPLTTSSGRVITELPIEKGQTIHLGLASYNRNPHVWGADASSFDPMRWLDGRYDSANLPGIGPYSNLSTFMGGARVCLGWRFSVIDMQVVLFELLSKFRFSFTPEQEKNLVVFLALNLMPLDVASGKPGLTLLVQPIQSQES